MDAANDLILSMVEEHVLRPDVISAVLERVVARLNTADVDATRREAELRRHLATLDTELARLAQAIATGGELDSLLAEVRSRERARAQAREEITALERRQRRPRTDRARIERDLDRCLGECRPFLGRHVAQTRQLLRSLLTERLVFTPQIEGSARRYQVTGQWSLGRIFAGLVDAKDVVSPTGHADGTSLVRFYRLLQGYATVRARALGRWTLKAAIPTRG